MKFLSDILGTLSSEADSIFNKGWHWYIIIGIIVLLIYVFVFA